MKHLITATLLAAVAVTGCSKEQGESISTENNVASFSASSIETRTNFEDDTWIDTDMIGISTDGFDTEYVNTPYVATTTGNTTDFTAVGETIVYPNVASSSSKEVTFYAYYPYSADKNLVSITPDGYWIIHDISGQKDNLAEVDLMTATSAPIEYYVGATYNNNVFTFKHNLTKVVLTIERNDNCPSLEGLTVTLENAHTIVTHGSTAGKMKDVNIDNDHDTGNIPLTVNEATPDGDVVKTATVTALLHPILTTSQKLHFTLDAGNVYSVDFNPTIDCNSAGLSYNYTILLGNDVPEFTGNSIGSWDSDEDSTDDGLYPEDVTNSNDVIDFSPEFSYTLSELNTDGVDGVSYAEAAAYTGSLNLTNQTALTSMAELIYFPNITDLTCNGCTSLTKLDLSANTKLTSLSCSGCALTELDITSCPNLTYANLWVGTQSNSGTLTLYVTAAQSAAGINQTAFDTTPGNYNTNVKVVVK